MIVAVRVVTMVDVVNESRTDVLVPGLIPDAVTISRLLDDKGAEDPTVSVAPEVLVDKVETKTVVESVLNVDVGRAERDCVRDGRNGVDTDKVIERVRVRVRITEGVFTDEDTGKEELETEAELLC